MRASLLLFLSFIMFSANGQKKEKEALKPFVLGVIDEVYSKQLSEKRELNIYLPEGYNPKDSLKYPVIYLLDGSANEDFVHIVGLVQYHSFEWINIIPKSIVVGIATVDRQRDFTFQSSISEDARKYTTSGHSDNFIAFLEAELQPYIAKRYNTNETKTIIGQSLGGLLATEILFKRPNLFNKYIIVSPSLWWDNGSILNYPVTNFQNKDIYISVGKEGLTPSIIPRVMEVDANLLVDKIRNLKNTSTNIYFDYLPDENHATIMHQAVSNSFRLIFNEKKHN
ncbi:MAG: alpha/beta hydrolase-fold protein [Bacteroidia bacterium]